MTIGIQAKLVSSDGRGFRGFVEDVERAWATATTVAVSAATAGLRVDLQAEIERANLGERLPNAVRSEVYPGRGKVSMRAAGMVWARGKGAQTILDAFSRGVTIRSKDGAWLAIPTEAAGKSFGRQRITPALWEQKTGLRLRFIYRPRPLPSLLVADLRAGQGKRGGFRKHSEKSQASGRNATTVPIFILLPQVSLRKRLSPDTLAKLWVARVPDLIDRALPREQK
jgi:hypothetical protein